MGTALLRRRPDQVGRVDCLRFEGYVCWFNSNDHPPPHFHVKRTGEWELRVFFLMEPVRFETVFSLHRVSSRVLREIVQRVQENRSELLQEWSEKVHHG